MPLATRIDCATGEIEVVEVDDDPIAVPLAVTMRQARRALLAAGLLHLVDPTIAAMPSPQREAAQIDWEYASEVRRDSDLVAALGSALGLAEEEVDALFLAAAAIQ